jgi:hypothetical protein
MAGGGIKDEEKEEDEKEARLLQEEATMPLEEILGEFQAGAKWIVIRGPLRGYNDTPCGRPTPGRPIGHPRVGHPGVGRP